MVGMGPTPSLLPSNTGLVQSTVFPWGRGPSIQDWDRHQLLSLIRYFGALGLFPLKHVTPFLPPSSYHQASQATPFPPGHPLLNPHTRLPTMEGPGHSPRLYPLGPPQHRALSWPLQRQPVSQGDAQEVVVVGTTKTLRGNRWGDDISSGDLRGVSPGWGCKGHVHTTWERDCVGHGIWRGQKVSPLQLVLTLHVYVCCVFVYCIRMFYSCR